MNDFKVTVTIPVYNAANFIERAVQSALLQSQTAEIILVEDFSSDNSWEICKHLASNYPLVHIYRHPDGKNHGCSASRSLAVQKSNSDFVAFLDADDYFLPGRFDKAQELFEKDPDLEGVYEAVGMYVEDDASLQRWKNAGRSMDQLHTMRRYVPAEQLFSELVSGTSGSFSIDGLVVKKSVFDKVGLFDETLPIHMDDVFFVKLAAVAKLLPGRLDEPVTMWRVHDHNRISAPRPKKTVYLMRIKFWHILWKWSRSHLPRHQQHQIFQALINDARFKSRFERPFPKKIMGLQRRAQLFLLPLLYPEVLWELLYWNSFLLNFSYWLGRIGQHFQKIIIA